MISKFCFVFVSVLFVYKTAGAKEARGKGIRG